MQAILLAGGEGTRLRPFTSVLPKPLVPIAGVPVLTVMINQLRASGVTAFVIAVNKFASIVQAMYRDGADFGVTIGYTHEPQPLGTIGPLRLVDRLDDDFLVANGDIVSDLDFGALFASHQASGCLLTIGLSKRRLRSEFGVIEFDGADRLTAFTEKPVYDLHCSMGCYAMKREVLDFVPPDTNFGLDKLVFALLAAGQPINVFRHDGYWLDLGRPEDYDQVNADLASGALDLSRFLGP